MTTPTQASTSQEAFEAWWQAQGQYGRAGGGDYEKTFAFNAWMAAQGLDGAGGRIDTPYDAEAMTRLLDAAVSVGDFEAIPLKHCPFCGPGNSIASVWFDDMVQRWKVGCGACGCSTGISARDKTPRPAIEAWNQRR